MKPKPFLLLLSIVLFAFEAHSQNWRPFNPDYRYHFTLGTSEEITHTIFADSSTTWPDDTVHYLNRILTFCDTCAYLKSIYCPDFDCVFNRTSPQFMQREVHYAMGSMFAMVDPNHYVINFQAQPGESWITDALNDIIATVDSVKEEVVLNSLDSVRYISTTNNRFIEISKHHGILRYPNYDTEEDYVLMGISGLDEGERLPTMEDLFDFAVGDELVYSYTGSSAISGCWHGIQKKRIMDRTDFADSTMFEVENIIAYHSWNCITPWQPMYIDSYYITTETITVRKSDFAFLNHANAHSLVNSNAYISNWHQMASQEGLFVPVSTHKDDQGYKVTYGLPTSDFNTCGYFITPDEMIDGPYVVRALSEDGWSNGMIYCGTEDITFGEHRGIVHTYQSDNFEFDEEYQLIATLLQGDTTGVVPSDATILKTQEMENIAIALYPNPAHEQLHFSSPAWIQSCTILSSDGRMIRQENVQGSYMQIDISNLSDGIYTLLFDTSQGRIGKAFVKCSP